MGERAEPAHPDVDRHLGGDAEMEGPDVRPRKRDRARPDPTVLVNQVVAPRLDAIHHLEGGQDGGTAEDVHFVTPRGEPYGELFDVGLQSAREREIDTGVKEDPHCIEAAGAAPDDAGPRRARGVRAMPRLNTYHASECTLLRPRDQARESLSRASRTRPSRVRASPQ